MKKTVGVCTDSNAAKVWARMRRKQITAARKAAKAAIKKATGPQIRWMRKQGGVIACYLSWDEHELPRMRKIVKCENHCRAKGEARTSLVKVRITEVK